MSDRQSAPAGGEPTGVGAVTSSARPRRMAFGCAALAGVAFAVFPLIRPWGDKTGDLTEMARAFADPFWVYSHLAGMIGWVLLAMATAVAATVTSRRVSVRAAWLIALGVAAVLPYYGAETFALHVLGGTSLDRGEASLVQMESLIRGEPVAIALFGVGLLVIAIGAVLLAVDTWKGGRMRWTGIPLAVLLGLYLPQFFTPDAARIAHGLLLGIACLLWGAVWAKRS